MKKLAFVFVAIVVNCTGAWAQSTAPSKPDPREFLRFDFVLKESENGKLVNSRNFQMIAATEEQAMSSIRSGDKIPVPSVGQGGTTIYIDVGVNLDVRRIHRNNDELTMEVSAEASSADPGTNVIRQAKWNSTIQIPLRKPVVIFSSDGPTSKRQVQLEVAATPIH
jgi:hypothetical protein